MHMRDPDLSTGLLDVRTVGEFNRGHMKGFNNIPVDELRERISEIEKGKPVYLPDAIVLRYLLLYCLS